MVELTTEQIADLRELQQFCAELNADLVIIGAIAYQYHFPRENRHTSDIDSAVALDLDDFAELEKRLQVGKWRRIPNREHRWRSSRGTLLDLIPAGTELRKAKQVTWPESQFTMSLVGFDHVFGDSEAVELSPELTLKIIPSIVLVLLKIVAFLEISRDVQKTCWTSVQCSSCTRRTVSGYFQTLSWMRNWQISPSPVHF
jgi:predicted nucleotidyltransferase